MPLPISVAQVVIDQSAQTVTRTRYGAATLASTGVWGRGTATTETITGQMQPLDDRTRQLLPEGVRLRARYVMHTTADVRGATPTASGTPVAGDTITWQGRTYQVYQDRDWNGQGSYTRCILADASAEP
jgi:hypothetical protein